MSGNRENRERAHSPLPEEYENMPVEKLKSILGTEIQHAPLSVADRFRRYLGVGINPPRDPVALRAARREAYTKHKQGIHKIHNYSVGQNAATAAPAAAAEPINYAHYYGKSVKQLNDEGSKRRKFPLFPITQPDLVRAARRANDLIYTQNHSDYIEHANERKAIKDDYEKLKRQFAIQEHRYPGAQFQKPYNTESNYAFSAPPRPGARGGKSKRVKRSKTCKSKRVKRSKTCKNRVHKRRN